MTRYRNGTISQYFQLLIRNIMISNKLLKLGLKTFQNDCFPSCLHPGFTGLTRVLFDTIPLFNFLKFAVQNLGGRILSLKRGCVLSPPAFKGSRHISEEVMEAHYFTSTMCT